MKRLFLYNLLMVICLASACKKIDIDKPVDGEPVFVADILVDGAAVNMAGGIDGYYMFTTFEKDNLDVYNFIGNLKLEGCDSSCGEGLEIQIRDYQLTTTGLPDVDGALNQNEYTFRSNSVTFDTTWNYIFENKNRITLTADSSSFDIFSWDIGAGFSIGESTKIFELDEGVPGPEVSLQVVNTAGGDSCISTQTQFVSLNGGANCSVAIQQEGNPGNSYNLIASTMGADPFQYNWEPGGSNLMQLDSVQIGQEYTVVVTDAGGCQSTASHLVNVQQVQCQANFTADVETISEIVDSTFSVTPIDPLQLSAVTIIYTSPTNNIYRSDLGQQDMNAAFKILEVEDYDDNDNGDPTKKLTLQFSCNVWDSVGNVKTLESVFEVIFGVAHPR